MYDSLRTAKIISMIMIVLGIVLFALELLVTLNVSIFGIVIFMAGFSVHSLTKAVRAELERLRVENVELKKQIREKSR